MRCPFRMAAFDQPDTCDSECAWLVYNVPTNMHMCAITAIATKARCAYVINYEQYQDKPVGALGRYSEKEGES